MSKVYDGNGCEIHDLPNRPGDAIIHTGELFAALCTHYGLRTSEVRGLGCRDSRRLAMVRRCISYTMHVDFGVSLSEVGRCLNIHHTSVMYQVRKAKEIPAFAERAAKVGAA